MDARLAREYRRARREPWNELSTTPARWAMVSARATLFGERLAIDCDTDQSWHGSYALHWRVDIGPGCWVDVWQVADDESCDCYADARANDEDPGKVPDHGHFGIVADVHWPSGDVSHDACWGYVWDWPGQDNARELAWAWEEIAAPVISDARESFANLPQWVRDSMAIMADV